MSFREKIAWVSLIATAAFAVVWLSAVQSMSPIQQHQPLEMLPILIAAVLLETVVAIGLSIVAALSNPREADAPADERDRLIDALSLRAPYFVFVAGSLVVIAALVWGVSAYAVINAAIGVLVVAELLRYAAQIYYYRRRV